MKIVRWVRKGERGEREKEKEAFMYNVSHLKTISVTKENTLSTKAICIHYQHTVDHGVAITNLPHSPSHQCWKITAKWKPCNLQMWREATE